RALPTAPHPGQPQILPAPRLAVLLSEQEPLDDRPDLPGGSAAVTERVLLLGAELGQGAAEARQVKDRVVAETAASRGLPGDSPNQLSAGSKEPAIRPDQGDFADVPAAPGCPFQARQALEDQAVLASVALTRPACRMDAGRTTERLNIEAGVFRQARQAAGLPVSARLELRVLAEGRAGLRHPERQPDLRRCHQLQRQVAEDLAILADLVPTGGREQQPLGRHRADCAAGDGARSSPRLPLRIVRRPPAGYIRLVAA